MGLNIVLRICSNPTNDCDGEGRELPGSGYHVAATRLGSPRACYQVPAGDEYSGTGVYDQCAPFA